MKHLVFVIWIIGFSLAWDIGNLIIAKTKNIAGLPKETKKEYDLNNFVMFLIWVGVAILLWFNEA
jgi:hypothetical protein